MFSKIKAFFFSVEHDVEAIIADFTNTIEKLEAAAAANLAEARRFTDVAVNAEVLADVAHAASEKAASVAAKIKALVA